VEIVNRQSNVGARIMSRLFFKITFLTNVELQFFIIVT
jgi:hypothetical protein